MRKKLFLLILTIIWIPFAFGEDYYPLREGNKWLYVLSNNIQMVVQVTGFTEIDGVRCAIVESLTETEAGKEISREYMAVDTEGMKVYISQVQDQEVVYDPPLTRIKLPLKKNEIWTSSIEQAGMDFVTTFETLGTKEIKTNMGTFNCIAIASRANTVDQESMISISYYSDGIGLVRQEMKIGDQTIVAALVSANVKPTEKIEAPKPSKIECPHCGEMISSSVKYCPECGKKVIIKSSEDAQTKDLVDPNEEAIFELYQSSLRKLMFYKPKNWNVSEIQYDNGVNVTSIVRPDESALVVFLSYPETMEDVNDSVSFAESCISLFQNNIPDLQGNNIKSSPAKDLTTVDISFTEGDAKGVGHAYFYYTDYVGTGFLLLARDDMWEQIKPVLLNITSNMAFSTQDIELLMSMGKALASKTVTTEKEDIINPASIIQKAGPNVPESIQLITSGLEDESISLEIPEGWNLEGENFQFMLTDDKILKNTGMISKTQTVIPTQVIIPGTISTTYQSPPEILNLVFNYEDIGQGMEIISEIPGEQVNIELAKEIKNMNKLRYHVDSRLIYAKLQNFVTEKTFMGIFSVQCISKPMSSLWRFSIDGCWAQEEEFDELLSLFIQVNKSIQVNKQPAQSDKEKQINILQQLNRDYLNSVANSDRIFDEYIKSNEKAIQKTVYTNWMWSQTTLGQGIWIAQNEGAQVQESNSWGIEEPSGNDEEISYNKIILNK